MEPYIGSAYFWIDRLAAALIRRLLGFLSRLRPFKSRNFYMDDELAGRLQALADEEQRPPDQLANDLLIEALIELRASQEFRSAWESLSPREQEVTALICLGYSNPQIAERLIIGVTTVKTHVSSILRKFNMTTRQELQMALNEWDFTGWE